MIPHHQLWQYQGFQVERNCLNQINLQQQQQVKTIHAKSSVEKKGPQIFSSFVLNLQCKLKSQ